MQSDGFWHRHHETADSEEPSLECDPVSSKGLLRESSSRFRFGYLEALAHFSPRIALRPRPRRPWLRCSLVPGATP